MKFILPFIFASAFSLIGWSQPLAQRTGGGNMNNGLLSFSNLQYIDILASSGARMTRVNLYPNDYWDFSNNVPKTNYADSLLLHLAEENIGVVLLFEHYAYFESLGQPLGDYSKWHQIGAAFAARYQPGSTFFVSNGITDYGVEYYTAINEPDLGEYMPLTSAEDPENYHDAIEGLADGVHSVAPSLKVIPGGFATENSAVDHTLNGFGTAIADLFNNGKLYGIDLHTYNDVTYAPILKYDNTNHVQFMAFYDFYEVKIGCGITADINFCPTEFGFKENTQGIDNTMAAKRLLTCIWGNLGAVLNDQTTSATEYALVWNLYNTLQEDPVYGMCYSRVPYAPTLKGTIFNLVMNLAKDMDFIHLDPFDKGEYILTGPGKKLWVFQNYNLLSSISGSSYTIDQIPANMVALQIYDWNGLVSEIPISNVSSYTVNNLNTNETYMFLAVSDSISSVSESKAPEQILASPNPFENTTELRLSPGTNLIRVFNAAGQEVEVIETKEQYIRIGANYQPGMYFITVEGDISEHLKIIRQ